MKKSLKLILLSILFLGLMFVLTNVVNATTIRETTKTDDNYDTIEDGAFVIGITKFDSDVTLTAARILHAANHYYDYTSDSEEKDLELYNFFFGDWYVADENNKYIPVTDEAVLERLNTIDIYYINNEEKIVEIDYPINLENGYTLSFETNDSSRNEEIKYEDGKLKIPALIDEVKVIAKNETGSETKVLDTLTKTDGEFKGNITFVRTFEELKKAIEDKAEDIRLGANIEGIGETITIPHTVNLEGNQFKLSFYEIEKDENGLATGLVINGQDSVVNNLTVEMVGIEGWKGNYAIQVYNATGVVLNNVTAIDGDAGILVNASEVELTGTTILNNNEFGGIEVSKGKEEGLQNSKLTVTGTIQMNNEATVCPIIWVEKDQGTVEGNIDNYVTTTETNDKNQTYYYSDEKYITIDKVSTLDELKNALTNEKIETIELTANIENISETITIGRTVTIEGNENALKFDELTKDALGVASALVIIGQDSVVNNLAVEMTAKEEWQGNYAIQVYGATGVVLNDVTAKNGDAGILVNGSEVELKGTTTLNNNEFGGIEVSRGTEEGLQNSKLTVTGTIVTDNEATTCPVIWVEKDQGTVEGEGIANYVATTETNDKEQTYYYSDEKYIVIEE